MNKHEKRFEKKFDAILFCREHAKELNVPFAIRVIDGGYWAEKYDSNWDDAYIYITAEE